MQLATTLKACLCNSVLVFFLAPAVAGLVQASGCPGKVAVTPTIGSPKSSKTAPSDWLLLLANKETEDRLEQDVKPGPSGPVSVGLPRRLAISGSPCERAYHQAFLCHRFGATGSMPVYLVKKALLI